MDSSNPQDVGLEILERTYFLVPSHVFEERGNETVSYVHTRCYVRPGLCHLHLIPSPNMEGIRLNLFDDVLAQWNGFAFYYDPPVHGTWSHLKRRGLNVGHEEFINGVFEV